MIKNKIINVNPILKKIFISFILVLLSYNLFYLYISYNLNEKEQKINLIKLKTNNMFDKNENIYFIEENKMGIINKKDYIYISSKDKNNFKINKYLLIPYTYNKINQYYLIKNKVNGYFENKNTKAKVFRGQIANEYFEILNLDRSNRI